MMAQCIFKRTSRKMLAADILVIAVCSLLMNGLAVADKLDDRVEALLEERKGTWRDMNVPERDGRVMYDLIVKNGYQNVLEIGTSTGHSTIWIAWALAKTGGRMTTVELNERRQTEAKANIDAAGLSDQVEFLLGNAHELVPAQPGPFDFVFSDADKDWYIQYFKDVYPKLADNACVASHNVTRSTWRGWGKRYLEFLKTVTNMEHTDDSTRRMLVTCRKRN